MKELLTAGELVAHMEEKGITFNYDTKESVEAFLSNNNYYLKLASYRSNYRKAPNGKYIGLDFAYLKELSTIDMHLRHQIIQMALDVEHFMKVSLLRNIEANEKEDGYCLIQRYITKKVTNQMTDYQIIAFCPYDTVYATFFTTLKTTLSTCCAQYRNINQVIIVNS